MGKYEILPGLAGGLGLISFSSLLLNVYKTHNTSSLTWTWLIVNTVAQILVAIYGFANKSNGLFIPSVIFSVGILYLIYVKFYTEDLPIVEKDVKKVV
jgi:hypothetical protein